MTCSARRRSDGGIVRPSAFAVFRLMTNSNLVGCSTGSSPGFAPFRILSTYMTGGSAGIGLGIAKRFAEEGARVFITGRRQSELDKAVTAIGGGATAVPGDISNLDDLDCIYETIKARAGRIDVLAVNAGYYEFGSFGEITEEHFDKIFNTNVRGLLFTVQKALPLLTEVASVILTGSIASIKGFPSLSIYNASKAAVRSFARSWIADLRARGIR